MGKEKKISTIISTDDDENRIKDELKEIEDKEKALEERLSEKEILTRKKENLKRALEELEAKKTPFDKGKEAALSEKRLKDNPYLMQMSEDQENYEEWLQGWFSVNMNLNSSSLQDQIPSSVTDRLNSIEESLRKLQPPEDEGFESPEKAINKAIARVTKNAEAQIRRARRYITGIAVISVLVLFAISLFLIVYQPSTEDTVSQDLIEQVQE